MFLAQLVVEGAIVRHAPVDWEWRLAPPDPLARLGEALLELLVLLPRDGGLRAVLLLGVHEWIEG